jgi:hypothetical protein
MRLPTYLVPAAPRAREYAGEHMTREKAITSFREFWPFYVREHARPLTRGLHYIGTTGVILSFAAAVVTGRWGMLALMPVFGYGFAWAAHFLVERNRPATFTYPLWSLGADFVMYGKMLRGQMAGEAKRLAGQG